MAIRRFEIPGKIINTSFAVDRGPTGQYSVDGSDDAGLTQDIASITGAADTKQITLSMWWNPPTLGTQNLFVVKRPSVTANFSLNQSAGDLQIRGQNSADSPILARDTTNSLISINAWNHILVSVDLALGSPAGIKVWINDTEATLTAGVFVDNAMGLAVASNVWFIMNERNTITGASADGCISSVWIDIDRFVDFDVENNRRKFIGADGRPVALGPAGAGPFGTAPILYFDNPVATWNENRGTGGDFRFVGGNTLDLNQWQTCADNPQTGTLA